MRKIQNTVKYEPIIATIEVSRKSGKPLSTYFINVGGATKTFPGFYFVPTYNENFGDDSIVQFKIKFQSSYYATNYPVQCEWNFGDEAKITLLDRSKNEAALKRGYYEPVYHRFTKTGPSVNNQFVAIDQPVTFTIVDKVGRRTVASTIVYPKPGA